jgi:hypothetical protein
VPQTYQTNSTFFQELVFPTAAGYLIDSSGAHSFTALVFCCTLANLCLFKPVLLYGKRVQQTLVNEGANNSGAEGEMQSMIVQPGLPGGE